MMKGKQRCSTNGSYDVTESRLLGLELTSVRGSAVYCFNRLALSLICDAIPCPGDGFERLFVFGRSSLAASFRHSSAYIRYSATVFMARSRESNGTIQPTLRGCLRAWHRDIES
jgi:hypothetical protein